MIHECHIIHTGEAEENASPDLAVSEMDDYGSLDGMKAGPISAGEIGPFASTKLEIIWNPSLPGKVDSEFLITFNDPLSESVSTCYIIYYSVSNAGCPLISVTILIVYCTNLFNQYLYEI
jgi:hypothetical protein